jgi:hypothetical protein
MTEKEVGQESTTKMAKEALSDLEKFAQDRHFAKEYLFGALMVLQKADVSIGRRLNRK